MICDTGAVLSRKGCERAVVKGVERDLSGRVTGDVVCEGGKGDVGRMGVGGGEVDRDEYCFNQKYGCKESIKWSEQGEEMKEYPRLCK